MTPVRAPFLAWPGWAHLRFAGWLTVLVSAWFAVVYCGTDWLTAHRVARLRVHLDGELLLPLVPSAVCAYMSIYPLFLMAPFALRNRRDLKTLARALAITISIAGIGFLLIPAKLAYRSPDAVELGVWLGLFNLADRLNLDYNLVPSLHVALSVVCIEFFLPERLDCKVLLRAWGVMIAAATVLTHQHHLVDVLTGYLLALAVAKFMRRAQH
jgi:membrane-associated phospholipid phosphatase